MIRLERGEMYRTRDGRKARCIAISTLHGDEYAVLCAVEGCKLSILYGLDGRFAGAENRDWDIVTRIEPAKITAKYAVPINARDYTIKTYEVGKEPDGAKKIEGSEREVEEK